MQAVILAAGRGTRMNSLTDSVPKPMLKVGGKSLLELKFDILPEEVTEIILIVGYQSDVIRNAFGTNYHNKQITYIEQDILNGTGGALWLAAPHLTGRFVVMMGDDLYGADDVERATAVVAENEDWAMLVEETESMAAGGRIVTDGQGTVIQIEEGDHLGKHGLMNTNMFVLDPRVFTFELIPKTAGSEEYGLPQTVLAASKAGGIPLHAVPATGWIQITSPEDLEKALQQLSTDKKQD